MGHILCAWQGMEECEHIVIKYIIPVGASRNSIPGFDSSHHEGWGILLGPSALAWAWLLPTWAMLCNSNKP